MKLEKMKAAVAGHYIPTKRAAEIYGEVIEADMPQVEIVEAKIKRRGDL